MRDFRCTWRSRSIRPSSSWRSSASRTNHPAFHLRTDDSMASASTHRCSVLVVDDDAEVRDLLRVALSADGYHVAAVSNGRDALHHLRSQAETCIIVLDLILPVMDGAQFRTAQLRDRSLSWIPVVVMSAAVDA